MLINLVAIEGFGEQMTVEIIRVDHDDPESVGKLMGKNVIFSDFFCTDPGCFFCPDIAKRIKARTRLMAVIAGKE